MILVDTSIWIEHFRTGDARLSGLLNTAEVMQHPFVTGEVALANLRNRDAVLTTFQDLPQAQVATDEEVLRLINANALYGIGIGYIDVHILASTLLTPETLLWTRDKRLLAASARLGLSMKAKLH